MTTAPEGTIAQYRSWAVEEFRAEQEPYYVPVGDEVELFRAAWESKIPVLLKGPTGCGKTRFVEYMAYHLNRPTVVIRDGRTVIENEDNLPLVTVACHEDLTASDLVGRYLLEGEETKWIDGPLTRSVKAGAICYLDEVVEARKDTTVLIHPLTDHRRILPDREKVGAPAGARRLSARHLVQPRLPERTQGPQAEHPPALHLHRVRLPAPRGRSARSWQHESGVDAHGPSLMNLAKMAEKIRQPARARPQSEGASTRLLIYAGKPHAARASPRAAPARSPIVWSLTDDSDDPAQRRGSDRLHL